MKLFLLHIKNILPFVLLLFANIPGYGQKNVKLSYLGIEDGLSNNIVTEIFSDHNGFMWFGTYDGLNRYDGYEFKVFRNVIGDSNSITSNSINKIDEDYQHNLWIGGQRDVSIFNPVTAKFSTPYYILFNGETKHSLKDNVLTLKVLNGKHILAGTEHNGLFYFKKHKTGVQIPFMENGKAKTDYYVSSIAYDSVKQRAYVFIQNKGLFLFDLQTGKLSDVNDKIQNANYLFLDSHRKLWLGANNGLFSYEPNTNNYSTSYVPDKTAVNSLIEDENNRLWIATDGSGILVLDKNKNISVPLASVYKFSRQVNSNSIYTIYNDNQHRKWIGTLRGGINILEPNPNTISKVVYGDSMNYTSPVQNFIFSFCEEDKNHIWIGTDGAGLRYWNRNNSTFKNYLHSSDNPLSISDNFVTSIVKNVNDNIWISTWFGGVNLFNQNARTFKHFVFFNTRTNSFNNHCWFLFQDSRKRLWAATVRNGALYRYNIKTQKFDEFDNNLSDLQCMAEDANGNLWGGTYSSLIEIDTLHNKHKFYNIGYTVRCIHEDKNHNFWIGTQEGGLLLFNRTGHSFRRFTTTDGLPSNTILRILEDKEGKLWLTTFNGLSRFDLLKKKFLNFSQADGLQSNQFSFNGALKLSSGEFLVGGIKGFNVFSPDSLTPKPKKRYLFLSSLRINNQPVEVNPGYVAARNYEQIKKIIVPYNQASVSLDFLALDYQEAQDLSYAYRLKGWDKNWNYVNQTRVANYSRLQEGDYNFEVKVSGPDGTWSQEYQLLQVIILPPWYRTWWAYCLYITTGGALVYFYVTYKNRQTKLKYEVQLAHLQTQKEKELNEKKIAFFTNVSHEFRTPVSLIINPIKDLLNKKTELKDRAELTVIYRNAQRLLRLVDQLLLFKKADSESDKLNLVTLDFYTMCENIFLCFSEQAKSKNIAYELSCEPKNIMIQIDREKIEIALFNVLSNAFKYTPENGKIFFAIEETSSTVNVAISDTGCGIPTAERHKLFERFYQLKRPEDKSGFGIGLYLVKNFIESHGGEVRYESNENTGTTFFITLKKEQPALEELSKKKEAQQPMSAKHKNESAIFADNTDITTPVKISAEKPSELLNELSEPSDLDEEIENNFTSRDLAYEKQTVLIIDDDKDLRQYLKNVFSVNYIVYEAASAGEGIKIAHKQLPDLIISDIMMKGLNGIELCRLLKEDETVSHIPIILLTGTSSDELQLEGMKSGADDYIKKPFDKDILEARVRSILKRRNTLQAYFYNEITLGINKYKVSPEYKEFLENCMRIIEDHLDDDQFSIKTLAVEIGMSHSNLYKKIKTVSGQTVAGFIRYVRLKKAAELLINTEYNINETASAVGFFDMKYFRRKFSELFGVNPSIYMRKYRKPFHNNQNLEENFKK